MLSKLGNLGLVGVYVVLFLGVWTVLVDLIQFAFDFDLDTSLTFQTQLETYVYPAIYAVEQLPVIGVWLQILIWLALFEFTMFVVRKVFDVLVAFDILKSNFVNPR